MKAFEIAFNRLTGVFEVYLNSPKYKETLRLRGLQMPSEGVRKYMTEETLKSLYPKELFLVQELEDFSEELNYFQYTLQHVILKEPITYDIYVKLFAFDLLGRLKTDFRTLIETINFTLSNVEKFISTGHFTKYE